MKNFKVFAVFLFSVFIVCVNGKMDCENNFTQYCVIMRGIESFGNISESYQRYLDNHVPFPHLSKAIKEIDKHMGDYQGSARDKMDSLRRLNNGLEDTYHNCVVPVNKWCLSSKRAFKLYITHIPNKEIADPTKKQIINLVTEKILDGYKQFNSSLFTLKKAIEETTSIKNVLGEIDSNLKFDFSSEGYYGKKSQEVETARRHRQKRGVLVKLIFLVNAAKAILELVSQVTGIVLELGNALRAAGISTSVVERKQNFTYDENIKIIETFYTVLNTKVREAQHYAEEAHIDLMEDFHNINAMHKVLIASNDTLLLYNTELEFEVIDALKEVRDKCLRYTNWYGLGDVVATQPMYLNNSF